MACSLKSIPHSTDFEAPVGSTVTLTLNDHIGTAFFAKAQYMGKQLVPAAQAVTSVTFDVAKDSNRISMVFVFSASTAGVSELDEACGGGSVQHLRDITGAEPFQSIRIVGV